MDSESLHRLVKVLADSGEAPTIEAAYSAFSRYGVRITLPASMTRSAEIVALTLINIASRSFLGNVIVEGPIDAQLTVQGFSGTSLREFMIWAGVSNEPPTDVGNWPAICVGNVAETGIRVWADGWAFGIGGSRDCTNDVFPPACVAAAGLAVNEAFSVLREDNPYAGRRQMSLSLWDLNARESLPRGPSKVHLVDHPLWCVGLGHLGQAYAWTLGFMGKTREWPIVLQDVDSVSASTLSTSLLSTGANIGTRKTRVVAAWLEARGFRASLVERRFDEAQRVSSGEPTTALFGVDNPAARQVMEGAGFSRIIDAGLGSGYKDFRSLIVRAFPGPSKAADLWVVLDQSTRQVEAPAYQEMLARGIDSCGVTTLATRAVGAPFVGCVAAGYALAEIFRRDLHGGSHSFIDVNLRDATNIEFEVIR